MSQTQDQTPGQDPANAPAPNPEQPADLTDLARFAAIRDEIGRVLDEMERRFPRLNHDQWFIWNPVGPGYGVLHGIAVDNRFAPPRPPRPGCPPHQPHQHHYQPHPGRFVRRDVPAHQPHPLHVWGIAQVCHEANRTYRTVAHQPPGPPWYATDSDSRERLAAAVRFALENPTLSAREGHERWMTEMLAAGWTHGPTKDAATKQHPCLVPYDDLTPEDRAKDALFLAIVRALGT